MVKAYGGSSPWKDFSAGKVGYVKTKPERLLRGDHSLGSVLLCTALLAHLATCWVFLKLSFNHLSASFCWAHQSKAGMLVSITGCWKPGIRGTLLFLSRVSHSEDSFLTSPEVSLDEDQCHCDTRRSQHVSPKVSGNAGQRKGWLHTVGPGLRCCKQPLVSFLISYLWKEKDARKQQKQTVHWLKKGKVVPSV